MRSPVLPFGVCIGLLTALAAPALAQEESIRVLEPLVGRWTTEVELRPARDIEEKTTFAGEIVATAVLDERFLRYEGFSGEKGERLEFTVLMSHDPRQRAFRRWVFRSNGVTAEATGKWDAETRTMTWTGVDLPDDVEITGTTRLTDDGFEETAHGKLADGTVLLDWTVTAHRAK